MKKKLKSDSSILLFTVFKQFKSITGSKPCTSKHEWLFFIIYLNIEKKNKLYNKSFMTMSALISHLFCRTFNHNTDSNKIWPITSCVVALCRQSWAPDQQDHHSASPHCGRGVVQGYADRRQNRAALRLPFPVWWALLRRRLLRLLPTQRRCFRPLQLRRARRDHMQLWLEGSVLHWTWVSLLFN